MVVEKWPAHGAAGQPFDVIRECLEAGYLQMTLDIAQGPVSWEEREDLVGPALRVRAQDAGPLAERV
jgi:hypothetical protein